MAATSLEVLGTVRPDGTLELDERLNVSPGRVKVRVESVDQLAQPSENLVEFVQRLRREMEAAGSHFMNDDEVTAWVEELRSEEDRIEEAYRQAGDKRQ
jgi:hypothetical protein